MSRAELDRDFDEFVASVWPRLRRAAYLLCHNAHEAEDLVQTALGAAYVRWSKVRRDDAYAYVRRSVVNAYLDSLRRRTPLPVQHTPDAAVGPDGGFEERSELVELLAPLTPHERTIVVWRYYLDAPEAEVAARLGISTGTVKSTASRALARLRATRSTPAALSGEKR